MSHACDRLLGKLGTIDYFTSAYLDCKETQLKALEDAADALRVLSDARERAEGERALQAEFEDAGVLPSTAYLLIGPAGLLLQPRTGPTPEEIADNDIRIAMRQSAQRRLQDIQVEGEDFPGEREEINQILRRSEDPSIRVTFGDALRTLPCRFASRMGNALTDVGDTLSNMNPFGKSFDLLGVLGLVGGSLTLWFGVKQFTKVGSSFGRSAAVTGAGAAGLLVGLYRLGSTDSDGRPKTTSC